MAVIYSDDIASARLQIVADALDAGADAAVLEICSEDYADVLATIELNSPCGTVVGRVLTFDTDPAPEDTSADASGTAAIARIKDSDGDVVIADLTVGTAGSGANIIVSATEFTSGDPIRLTSASITHA